MSVGTNLNYITGTTVTISASTRCDSQKSIYLEWKAHNLAAQLSVP